MGRRLKYPNRILAAFAPKMLDDIAEVLRPREDRTEFIRRAVEWEVARRREMKMDLAEIVSGGSHAH